MRDPGPNPDACPKCGDEGAVPQLRSHAGRQENMKCYNCDTSFSYSINRSRGNVTGLTFIVMLDGIGAEVRVRVASNGLIMVTAEANEKIELAYGDWDGYRMNLEPKALSANDQARIEHEVGTLLQRMGIYQDTRCDAQGFEVDR